MKNATTTEVLHANDVGDLTAALLEEMYACSEAIALARSEKLQKIVDKETAKLYRLERLLKRINAADAILIRTVQTTFEAGSESEPASC